MISKILVLDASKRPTLEEIMSDAFMSAPYPKTMPRSTLACPPAKNFMDQYVRGSGVGLSQKSSAANFERVEKAERAERDRVDKVAKRESEKELNLKAPLKETLPKKDTY